MSSSRGVVGIARAVAVALVGVLAVACCRGAGGKPSAGPGDPDDAGARVTAPPAVEPRRLALDEAAAALWPRGSGAGAHAPPQGAARDALVALVDALWRGVPAGEPPPALVAHARAAGVELALWEIAGTVAWVVREPDDARRGAGIYVVRAGAPPPGPRVLIQAPHAYFDVGTGAIAVGAVAGEGVPAAVRGLFANSIHRHQRPDGSRQRDERGPADVAHADDHPFHAATEAVLDAGAVLVVQLHGFDDAARDGDVPGAIVSAGDRDGSTPASTRVADGLAAALGLRVARFPEDTLELGGVTNAQRALVARRRDAGFVHVELGRDARDRLRADPAAAAELGRILAAAAEVAPR